MPWFPPHVPVGAQRARVARVSDELRRNGVDVQPVHIEGRSIARSFWELQLAKPARRGQANRCSPADVGSHRRGTAPSSRSAAPAGCASGRHDHAQGSARWSTGFRAGPGTGHPSRAAPSRERVMRPGRDASALTTAATSPAFERDRLAAAILRGRGRSAMADAPSAPARAPSGRGAGYRTQGAAPRGPARSTGAVASSPASS